MRKILLAVTAIVITLISAKAVDFPAGTYYFDNRVTKWAQPQVIISNGDATTTVVDMEATEEEPTRYRFVIEADIPGIEGYYFCDAGLRDGQYALATNSVLQILSSYNTNEEGNEATLARTDMMDTFGRYEDMCVFCPHFFTLLAGNLSRKGYWRTIESYSLTPTGTIPVLYINTDDGEPIDNKTTYKTATYYFDGMGIEGVENLGSAEKPLVLQIKGRGNATWNNWDKQGFRLKLDKKNSIYGLIKSKHYVLLAHADDWGSPCLKDEAGFEISRRLGLDYTVRQKPIEYVFNGEYQGLYFIAEKIRVDADHVNIVEQKDNETDPELITGGWLMEIDNIYEANNIEIYESAENPRMWITPDTPEVLSTEQREYITNLLTTTNAAIYTEDKNSTEWENYIDLEALARYYLVYEINHNPEAFHGSCYLYKDKGEDTKFIFGPVWDFGNSFNFWDPENPTFIMEHTSTGIKNHWIRELLKYPRLQAKVREIWKDFYKNGYPGLTDYLLDFANGMQAAGNNDYKRWRGYSNNYSFEQRKARQGQNLDIKVAFLNEKWGGEAGDINGDGNVDSSDVSILLEIVLNGGEIEESVKARADLGGDGYIDSSDVSALLEIVLAGNE